MYSSDMNTRNYPLELSYLIYNQCFIKTCLSYRVRYSVEQSDELSRHSFLF